MKTDRIDIPSGSTGLAYALTVHRFGEPGDRPTITIQAALHADEIPGMICAATLRRHLQACEAAGEIRGEIILVPVANPIGLAQDVLGDPLGRFSLGDGGNFNRGFPSLAAPLAERVKGSLGPDPDWNIAAVRAALADLLAEQPATTAADHLKKALLGLALASDYVLDLHCDAEAAMHLYTHPASVEAFAPLARRLGCKAILVAAESGGDPFDEALSRPWSELAALRPDVLLPMSCHATTVELRGQRDVSETLADADAAAIIGFLQDIGIVAGAVSPPPPPLCEPTPLAASQPLIAPIGGILTYRRDVGEPVGEGEVLADIVDPITGQSTAIPSPCAGMFFARTALRFVKPGRRLGKVAGVTPTRSGYLLSP